MKKLDFILPVEHKPYYLYYNAKESFIEHLARDIFIKNALTVHDCFEAANVFWEEMEKRRKGSEE